MQQCPQGVVHRLVVQLAKFDTIDVVLERNVSVETIYAVADDMKEIEKILDRIEDKLKHVVETKEELYPEKLKQQPQPAGQPI